MLVDGLGTASLINGVLRIETLSRNSKGEDVTSGELHIPAARIAIVEAGLQKLVEKLREKIADAQNQQEEEATQS